MAILRRDSVFTEKCVADKKFRDACNAVITLDIKPSKQIESMKNILGLLGRCPYLQTTYLASS